MTKKSSLPPFFGQEFASFKPFEFPGVNMETLLSSYQKNMELMNATQKIATETAQTLMEIQNQYVQKVVGQMNQQAKHTFSKAPLEEKATHQAEVAKTTVDELIRHLRTTNAIIAQSNEQIIESIQRRFKESLDESSEFVKKSPKKPS
jgi:phasin family protein